MPADPPLVTTGDGGPALVGGRCPSCDRASFPREDTCPWCGAVGVVPAELPRTGTLWGWTAVTAPPPGYRGEVPFGFGVVELPGTVRVVSRLTEADPSALRFGQTMRLVAVDVEGEDGTTFAGWAFEPEPEP